MLGENPQQTKPTNRKNIMITAHTLGTWRNENGEISSRFAKKTICSIHGADCEAEANARLITEAPELLGLLEIAVLRIGQENEDGNPIMSAWLKDAKEVLASVKGESK